MSDTVKNYIDRFGAYAFGVVSLLIIWFAIVRPELQANRATAAEIQRVAETLRATADLINQATVRLERLEKSRK